MYRCYFCGLATTPDEAIEAGWEPYFWDEDGGPMGLTRPLGGYQDDLPTCPECCRRWLRPTEHGEFERVRPA